MKQKKVLLMILDGWGIGGNNRNNAVYAAKTPILDGLKKKYPQTSLLCSGKDVGLPPAIMGNSEVGHLNIGAGRVVYQNLLKINESIKNKIFFENFAVNSVMDKVLKTERSLHVIGLLSDAGVHSHINHLFAIIDMAKKKGIKKLFVHAITDGRDTPPDSGLSYIKKTANYLSEIKCGQIASICGRYFAMDRDKRWKRIKTAYNLYTKGEGIKEEQPIDAIKKAYQKQETDEFIKPIIIIDKKNKPLSIIKDNDGIIFFNFRADRAREITAAFTEPNFNKFIRAYTPKLCEFVSMTQYDDKLKNPLTAFAPNRLKNILGEVIANNDLRQLRIAETEKYAHVTYFFNAGEEKSFLNEDRILIESPKSVATYDQKPEMSAFEVTEKALKNIKKNKYHLIVINFANMDMVGHTGKLDAAIKACETVDNRVGKILPEALNADMSVIVTADHGNAEIMQDKNGKPHTAHTTNPVPFILVEKNIKNIKLKIGRLADIAPTILDIMNIKQPKEMTGNSLIVSVTT
ncbi:MAG: 2,3-bisphosphoglycerate-independent phosphoglycerate mutase [Deltaproteobacteria bacterium]|nr:2,3-bisphosphoglycerate-independent phosphoglycerate mutase [Deltaproteobacteria bacterium]